MDLCECCNDPNVLLLPCVFIFLYLGGLVVSIVNTAGFFQHRKDVYSADLIAVHLAFCVVGSVAFFCVSSVLWLWSAKYSFSHADRMWRLCVGLWFMCFLKDLPLLIIETHAYLQVGWQDGTFMDASFIVQILFFVPSALTSSTTISWYAAGFLERQFGDATVMVGMQGKKIVPRASPEVCAELAAAAAVAAVRHPPPLPMQEVCYQTSASPRRLSVARVDSTFGPSVAPHEPLTGTSAQTYVTADYGQGVAQNLRGVQVGVEANELEHVRGNDTFAPYPRVI